MGHQISLESIKQNGKHLIYKQKTAMAFTCITCGVAFKDADIQRLHYKSDWHRYNLKRKVASFPPVDAQEFQTLVLEQRSKQADDSQDKSKYCEICRKSFSGPQTFENHLASKKHLERMQLGPKEIRRNDKTDKIVPEAKKMDVDVEDSDVETDSEVEEVSSDEWNEDDENNPINKNDCLFCPHHSRNLTMNLKHMTEAHSFFVPDVEYCVDLKGMMLYLGAKICQGFVCLWCNEVGKKFSSVSAVRKHMIDKGHCKVLHEGDALLEFTDYYDYSSSYPDAQNHDADEEIDIAVLDDSEYQLTLPSGATIGHRSLMRYYKQSLDPKKGMVVQTKIQNVLSTYRQSGYTPLQKEAAQRKARDIQYMRRAQQKFYSQVGCKANKLQKHFRPQVNF